MLGFWLMKSWLTEWIESCQKWPLYIDECVIQNDISILLSKSFFCLFILRMLLTRREYFAFIVLFWVSFKLGGVVLTQSSQSWLFFYTTERELWASRRIATELECQWRCWKGRCLGRVSIRRVSFQCCWKLIESWWGYYGCCFAHQTLWLCCRGPSGFPGIVDPGQSLGS